MNLRSGGFGLVQVMVAAGLVGGLAIVIMNLNKLGLSASSKAESNQEVLFFVDDLDKRMKGTEMCKETFAGQAMATEMNLTELTFNGNPLFPVNSKVGAGKVTVLSYRLVNDSVPIGGEGSGTAYLEMELKKSNASGGRVVNKRLALFLSTDTAGNIVDCVSDLNSLILNIKTELCNDLGGQMTAGICSLITPTIGDVTTLICNSSNNGRIAYDLTALSLQVCNGTNWEVVGGAGGADCPALSIDTLPTDPGGDVTLPATGHLEVSSGTCSGGGSAILQCKDGVMNLIWQNCVISGP